jgi:hypothetical protein
MTKLIVPNAGVMDSTRDSNSLETSQADGPVINSPSMNRRNFLKHAGGGPPPEAATLIRGSLTAKELRLTMTNLEGRELAAWRVKV